MSRGVNLEGQDTLENVHRLILFVSVDYVIVIFSFCYSIFLVSQSEANGFLKLLFFFKI